MCGCPLITEEYTQLSKGRNTISQTRSKLWLCETNASQHLLINMASESREGMTSTLHPLAFKLDLLRRIYSLHFQ